MTNPGQDWNELHLSEDPAVEVLQSLGYVHVPPEVLEAERESLKQTILTERLGRALKKLNPSIIYCHTRGFEHGPRDLMPGNDQTGAALGGISWEDGGVSDGGKPIWARTSLGDTGNGFLSALGVVQALYHRDRTGEGQFVDTSISYAALLNTSYTYLRADGTEPDRPRLDRDQLGLGVGYRLGWSRDR